MSSPIIKEIAPLTDLELTAEQQRRIKNLKIKRIFKGIVDSDEPDNVKSHIVQYVIDLYVLKKKQDSAKRHAKPENKEKKRKREAAWRAKPENKEKQRKREAAWRAKPENKEKKRKTKNARISKAMAEIHRIKGGASVISGITENLDLAHRDPRTKLDGVRNLVKQYGINHLLVIAEYGKCELLTRKEHKAYDCTWVSLGYPQTDASFWVFVSHYKAFLASGFNGTYRKFLENNPP